MKPQEELETILSKLFQTDEDQTPPLVFDVLTQFDEAATDRKSQAHSLNAAFLLALAGNTDRATHFLSSLAKSNESAKFYQDGIKKVREELKGVSAKDPDFSARLSALSELLENGKASCEEIWAVFFPEAKDLQMNREEKIISLRAHRTVSVTELNPEPIQNPAKQILFTSNVLLTIPSESSSPKDLGLNHNLTDILTHTMTEPQDYWYDHPIQIGVDPEKNEVIYGLQGLDKTFEFERNRGNISDKEKLACLLSVSVTHRGLQPVCKDYLQAAFRHSKGLKNIDLYVFTELDTQKLLDKVLIPAAELYTGSKEAAELLNIFGVDGKYGRHYSFLKAILPIWQSCKDPNIQATFKIDLDQVFPQNELVTETKQSAFEHFTSPLWGAQGLDTEGQTIELGMIAGALVNERDIAKSLFAPDVPFPNRPPTNDEYFFFSALPQALSSEAEMMTRYNAGDLNGVTSCLQRIHVTGGTNGILLKSLMKHRPFTPSFIGRAEDQAYILSVLGNEHPRLAYLHKDGLIMRHDKEAFAQEAIEAARAGKMVGDYVRLLYFSAYAKVLTNDVAKLKRIIDPFTGSFVSKIPITVALLQFALKVAALFQSGQDSLALDFMEMGVKRIAESIDFSSGNDSPLKQQYERERRGWDLFYDTLTTLQNQLDNQDVKALKFQENGQRILNECAIRF
ncbi:MAG: hypothetical protein GKR87_05160 [Kiritimatiellae bacterium]|nr:hypothetical protein [Kiritimatiellia bacterium]